MFGAKSTLTPEAIMADQDRATQERLGREKEVRERQLSKDREQHDKIVEEASKRMNAKPTPTQEELDRAALGEYIEHHEDDGSGPDPRMPDWHQSDEHRERQSRPQPSQQGYQTRQSRPVQPTSTHSTHPSSS
jgi:hypothetical protein